ncbi:hypothetical protein RirG_150690 [Rhizophagus irregularis DAOM 197198w]|uniref:Uncharacterized protein n=1 Tax=Rhizophagus irregularis (strain DAOM 197198w) TaxID=1432141 RepID=A0A015KUK6_RHIIW|nr:hypothetical protein RirG_150690 [Rhizophagus irregularis DAOM 197198w]
MVQDMAALLGPKKLLVQYVAYFYNAVLLLRLEFYLQTTLFSENTIHSIIKPMFSVLQKKAELATTTPLALLFLKLPFSIQNAFYRFLSSHIASWQKIFIHPDFRNFAFYAISYLQGYLGAESCPTVISLKLWSQVVSLRTHTLFNSILFSSRLNITWSLPFQPPRWDLQTALPLRSILPHSIFQTAWKLWKNLNIFVLAQLASPCGRYLMNWSDLHYLASPCLLDHTVKDYHFYPQWTINFNSAPQTLSVGRVCITYKKQNSAIMPHLLPKSAIKQRCNSERCFFNVCLSETVGYPTRNAKVFAAYLPITLSTSWSYATSLALVHLTNLFSPDSFALSSPSTTRIEDDVLPLSVHTLYTDELFFSAKDSSPPSMTSAWLALDDDDCAFLYAFLQPCVLKSMPLY